MIITKYHDVVPMNNSPPGVIRYEVFNSKTGARNFSLRIFEVSPGGQTVSHKHPWEHEYFIYSGKAILVSGEKRIPVTRGTAIYVAPDEHHSLINSGKTMLRFAVATPLAQD